MNTQELARMAAAITENGRGILAADESTATIGKRFQSIQTENTEENRRAYRELLFTAPGIGEFISGVICYDETIRQKAADGRSLVQVMQSSNMIPGIKVDTGAKPLAGAPGETVTEGLDGLRDRLKEYHALGARFAKWRAVVDVSPILPSDVCIDVNAHALARYAALCQEAGIVPIVEPEVLMDGDHDIRRCLEVTTRTLERVFAELREQRVLLEGILLKPNMVVTGMKCPSQATVNEVARLTVECLRRTVPAAVPGIVFLSGGQSDERATEHLHAMNAAFPGLPWKLSFSYGRALQAPALKAWRGKKENVAAAQKAVLHRARMNRLATLGQYQSKLEQEAA